MILEPLTWVIIPETFANRTRGAALSVDVTSL